MQQHLKGGYNINGSATTSTGGNPGARELWEHIFGDRRGVLEIWSGLRINEDFSRETIERKYFNYPASTAVAEELALEKSAEKGREVYFCAHLLTAKRRIKETAAEISALWGDLDGALIPNGSLTPTAIVQSSAGNFHCYWRLTDPIPPETAEELNKRLADKIGADPSGFDLTQLLRVPGTKNYKRGEPENVYLINVTDEESYSSRELDEVLPEFEDPKEINKEFYRENEPPITLNSQALRFWRGENPKLKDSGKIDRSGTLLNIGCVLYDAGANRPVVVAALAERDRVLGFNKYTNRRDAEVQYHAIANELESNGRTQSIPINLNGSRGKVTDKPTTLTHDELRDRFLTGYSGYAFGLGEWQRYAQGVWSRAPEARIKGLVSEVVDAAKPEGVKPTASVVNSVTELAKYKTFVDDDLWDADPDILVCGNGALHIPTGALRSHDRGHYATSAVPYDFDPDAKAPAWKLLLSGTVPEAADFLQEFAGYALTTDTLYEIALWLYGPPGSGRSTVLTGLEAMLGPRAGILGLADLERSQFALANVAGKTLMTATEQPSSYLASTNVLNALISGEAIQVERKFRDPYEITPRAKLAWAMNELPRVGDANSGIFRRVKVVSLPQIPPDDRDPEIKEYVKTEGPGILNWALEGLARLRERGRFDIPEEVEDATARFKTNNDVPALFIADKCIVNADVREKAGALYAEYKLWCEENGHRPQSSTRLADDWQRLGFERYRAKGSTYYRGVRVRLPGD